MDNKYEFYLYNLRTAFGEMDTGAVTQNYVEKGYMLKQATPITVNDSSAPVATYLLLVFEKVEELLPLNFNPFEPEIELKRPEKPSASASDEK